MDILALFDGLQPHVTATTRRQFSRIAWAMLVMPGRVTMLGLSRWAGKGGSYRTVQRFFSQALPWAILFWVFFRRHVYCPNDAYLLVGDEVVATKAGKHTHGLDRFFASLYGKPVPGLAFFALSLVSIQQRRSFPIRVEQVVRSDAEKAASKARAAKRKPTPSPAKHRPGRPKGSKNKPKAAASLTPELGRITGMLGALRQLIAGVIPLTYLMLDGHFGNHNALHMARQHNLHLISKLRCDAALYFPYTDPYAGRGPRRKYGRKVTYTNLPAQYLKETTVEGDMQTCVYQAQLLHKEFPQPLNVVILVKTNLRTQAQAHVILFSSDRTLAYAPLIDYYGLRFQIEFAQFLAVCSTNTHHRMRQYPCLNRCASTRSPVNTCRGHALGYHVSKPLYYKHIAFLIVILSLFTVCTASCILSDPLCSSPAVLQACSPMPLPLIFCS